VIAFGLTVLSAPLVIWFGFQWDAARRTQRALDELTRRGWALTKATPDLPPPEDGPTKDEEGEGWLDSSRHRFYMHLRNGRPWSELPVGLRRLQQLEPLDAEDFRERCGGIIAMIGAIERNGLRQDPITPIDASLIDRELQALEDPRVFVNAERHELAAVLERFPPTDAGLDALEKAVASGDEYDLGAERAQRVRELMKYPRLYRKLIFLDDRARFAALAIEILDALSKPTAEMRRRAAELQSKLDHLDPPRTPLTTTQIVAMQRLASWAAEVPVRLRLVRMALALAATKELPEKAPLELDDPFAPGQKIHWRRIDSKHGRLWSVGVDGKDDGGQRPRRSIPWDMMGPGFDLCFDLDLPD
jgi:hypothetical protein